MACGVFASVFILLPFVFLLLCPCFCSFALLFVLWLSLLWLSFVVLFPALSFLSLWLVFGFLSLELFFFPFGIYAKRKGAKVLLFASSLVLLWVALFENRSGFFISYSCRPLALLERPEKRRYMWQFWNKYHKAIF